MDGYRHSGRCRLVAVADIDRANAEAFTARHEPDAAIFTDAVTMMREAAPDIVSVCLWPHLHAEIVCALAPLRPRLIFCEKPMDIHWDAALRMHEVCREHGVALVFNHQRRYNLPLMRAREMLEAGEIGGLRQIEGAWLNLSDTGTHVLDLMFAFNGDTPAEWVMGQIDMRGAERVFGAVQTGSGITEFRFRNGVRATYRFGPDHADLGYCLRLHGERGVIDVLFEAPWLRIRRHGQPDWEPVETGESIHDDAGIHRAIADAIDCLEANRTSPLASENALRATEVIFATEASCRRRGRIDLPLPPMRSPLLEMLERGEIETDL